MMPKDDNSVKIWLWLWLTFKWIQLSTSSLAVIYIWTKGAFTLHRSQQKPEKVLYDNGVLEFLKTDFKEQVFESNTVIVSV